MTDIAQIRKTSLRFRISYRVKEAIRKNWALFNTFVLIWFIAVFPVFYLFEKGIFTFVAAAIMVSLIILDNAVIFIVAERNPTTFLKVQKMERYFTKIFWLFLYLPSLILVLVILVLPTQHINNLVSTFPFEPVFVMILFFFIGATFYQIGIVGNVRHQPRVLKAVARASLRVLSDSLTKSCTGKRSKVTQVFSILLGIRTIHEDKWKHIRLFENGLNSLNGLFINQFNFEFCNIRKYNDYFRFVVWTDNKLELERIRRTVDVLECTLRGKLEVADVLLTTKQIVKEKQFISQEELFQDLDFKTGIGRWYSHNKEIIKIGLPTFSLIVSVLVLLTRLI